MLALTPSLASCQGNSEVALGLSPAGLEQVPLTVTANGRVHRFIVEVAATGEQQQMGLMNRSSLAPDRGMVFPFERPRIASFWMKNTLIPLDIIFVKSDGTIANIAENTVPLDLNPAMSVEPVGAVLEIPGGRAAELGIGPGAKVEWKVKS